MQLTELKTFLTIIETGSLVRASEVLNVTQSTITTRLKSLESELGQTLVNRKKSGATPTAAGLRLQRYANTISDLWHQAKQHTAMSEQLSTICNIAVHPDLWEGLGEHLFNYMCLEFPDVGLSIWQGSQQEIAKWVKDGLTDIALNYSTSANASYTSVPVYDDELILVATDVTNPIKFDPKYVFVEGGEEFGQEHAAAYADASIARITFGSADLGLNHILNVGGSAYLPKRLVQSHLLDGQLVELPDAPNFNRTIFLYSKKASSPSWSWVESEIKIKSVLLT